MANEMWTHPTVIRDGRAGLPCPSSMSVHGQSGREGRGDAVGGLPPPGQSRARRRGSAASDPATPARCGRCDYSSKRLPTALGTKASGRPLARASWAFQPVQ